MEQQIFYIYIIVHYNMSSEHKEFLRTVEEMRNRHFAFQIEADTPPNNGGTNYVFSFMLEIINANNPHSPTMLTKVPWFISMASSYSQ